MVHMNVIEKIFLIINRLNLNYCVVSNPSTLPDCCVSDIDLIYTGVSERALSKLINTIEEETGAVCIQQVTTGYKEYSYMLAIKSGSEIEKIQLDFFEHLYHKDFGIIMKGDRILARKRKEKCFYIPSDLDALVYTVMRRLAKGQFTESHYQFVKVLYNRIDVQIREREKKQAQTLWSVIEAIVDGEFESIRNDFDLAKCIKDNASKNSLKDIISIFGFKMFKFFPRRLFCPLGMSIAFLAPDGAGKTSIINHFYNDSFYQDYFASVVNRYFRPRLLKNLGHYNTFDPKEEINTNPDPHSVQLNSVTKSIIRFMFYNVDFILGNAFVIYPHKVKRNLIIYDRYFYDYFADMKRYQYNLPEWIPALFSWMIPKPDIVFVLDAPANVIHQRKPELTLCEIDEITRRFKQNSRFFGNCYFVDVDKSLEDITRDIRLIVYEYLLDRKLRR